MEIISLSDYDVFNKIISKTINNFELLPTPLPWIEPSINMLYLESISNFLFGQYMSSILTMGVLLEHTLKMAIIDPENCGNLRKISNNQIKNYNSLLKVLSQKTKIKKLLKTKNNIDWWDKVGRILRNKSAHFVIHQLLKKFGTEKYLGPAAIDEINHAEPGNWGYIWHRFSEDVSRIFIKESTEQLNIVLINTKWKPDTSWWESQKTEYDNFFNYNWKINDMINSLKKISN